MNIQKRWASHLKKNNMTYREHWKFAVSHGVLCLEAGLLLIIHGLLPCFFERTGSILVKKLNQSFNRHKQEINNCKTST